MLFLKHKAGSLGPKLAVDELNSNDAFYRVLAFATGREGGREFVDGREPYLHEKGDNRSTLGRSL